MTHKPIIHFAHANGIPSQTYQKLFDLLADEYDIIRIPVLGAHKGFAVDDQWFSLTKQVLQSIALQAKGRKVIGLGHSLGATTTYQASLLRPDLFSKVILMDSPMIMGKQSFAFHLTKIYAKHFSNRFVDKITPAKQTVQRRSHWHNKEDAYNQLRNKALFKDFDEACFQGYIDGALIKHPQGGYTLCIPAENEAEIFRTNPSLYWLPMQIPTVPTYQLCGKDSLFMRFAFPARLKKKTGIDYKVINGSHMFPLEHPENTVKAIKKLLKLSSFNA